MKTVIFNWVQNINPNFKSMEIKCSEDRLNALSEVGRNALYAQKQYFDKSKYCDVLIEEEKTKENDESNIVVSIRPKGGLNVTSTDKDYKTGDWIRVDSINPGSMHRNSKECFKVYSDKDSVAKYTFTDFPSLAGMYYIKHSALQAIYTDKSGNQFSDDLIRGMTAAETIECAGSIHKYISELNPIKDDEWFNRQ